MFTRASYKSLPCGKSLGKNLHSYSCQVAFIFTSKKIESFSPHSMERLYLRNFWDFSSVGTVLVLLWEGEEKGVEGHLKACWEIGREKSQEKIRIQF